MSLPPPPQGAFCSLPELDNDAMSAIFLRIPPDDPKTLVRAAAACTSWRDMLCDDSFVRHYREFHGVPPMLGFLHNMLDEQHVVSSFISTASFRPPACHDRRDWRVIDSRHGLVLFHTPSEEDSGDFAICDLITHHQWQIHADSHYAEFMSLLQRYAEDITWNAMVLCAKDGCDHLCCHGAPFLVAIVCSADKLLVDVELLGITLSTVYASATREWSPLSIDHVYHAIHMTGHSALVGNKVYFQCAQQQNDKIVEYDMCEDVSVIFAPFDYQELEYAPVLMGVDAGMLLFRGVHKHTLYLWLMEAGQKRAKEWARRRAIKLEPVLPQPALSCVWVVGFAEGVGAIFLSTEAGLYTTELNSGRSNMVHGETSIDNVMPYMSFYTRAWGRSLTTE